MNNILFDIDYENICNKIDYTVTGIGKKTFDVFFKQQNTNINIILQRQNIIKSMDIFKVNRAFGYLNLMKKSEKSILWFLQNDNDKVLECLYYKSKFFNISWFLGLTLIFQIYLSPLISVAYPAIISIISYFILNNDSPMKIPFSLVSKLMSDTFFKIDFSLLSLISNGSYLYQIFQGFQNSQNKYRSYKHLYTHLHNIQNYLYYTNLIGVFYNIKTEIINFNYLNIGKNINFYVNRSMKNSIIKNYNISGLFDVYTSMCYLYYGFKDNQQKYNFVTFGNKLEIDSLWHPSLSNNIRNSIKYKTKNIAILTGKNGDGKSCFMKNIALCVYMSQIFGIAPCNSMITPVFDGFYTNINNLTHISQKSLFQKQYFNSLDFKNNHNKYKNILILIDEIYSATHHDNMIQLSKQFLTYLSKNCHNSFGIISTHEKELTNIQQPYFKNYKMENFNLKNGIYEFDCYVDF